MPHTRLRHFSVWFDNGEEFHRIKREVFGSDVYFVELDTKTPVIVDVGAHIGLATLYFKMLYPDSKVLAIEPNPSNLVLLNKNIEVNRLENVRVLPVAVGGESGQRDFYIDETEEQWFSAGSFFPHAWNNTLHTKALSVEQQRLSRIVPQVVDLLKIDAEGAEEEILFELNPHPDRVKLILFEFHPVFGKTLEKIERKLTANGYALTFFQRGRKVSWQKTRGLVMVEARPC